MRLPLNMLGRVTRLTLRPIPGLHRSVALTTRRHFSARIDDPNRRVTMLQSMREFFMHPLTWDRNNGYLNVLLALAIFGFCFFNSCAPCEPPKQDEIVAPKKQ
ncbi:uncharacterized protein Dwil_GK27152 [Drosophila willistoni]|uniref:Uncharacterized protein n=1 Tax=Drosophila willistoni TaxID=7260 RepID=A0A0Q9WUE3_DROWI|nr:uncharacterized protein LOC26529154 [Drosophila willistoni]KRF99176.1 uncharacterized protein Dwil_GK27152 [Drosophila willistoni]